MGSYHHFALGFIGIFLAIIIPTFVTSGITMESARTNTQYDFKNTAAVHGAMQMADPKGLATGSMVWSKEKNRKRAITSYFLNLKDALMESTNDNELMVSVPIILMIDLDGFYINYNALFDKISVKDYETKLNDFESPMQMGSLIAWGEVKYNYYIRYYLNDYVEVTDAHAGATTNAGKKYTGDRHDVADALEKDHADEDIIKYLDGTEHVMDANGTDLGEAFILNKEEQMITGMETLMETYINQYNYSAGRNGGGYELEIPHVTGEMWHRMLENPTFIAFLQGKNIYNGRDVINTYAYAGAEMFKGDVYFITSADASHDIYLGKEQLGTESKTYTYHSLRQTIADGKITETTDGDIIYLFTDKDGKDKGMIIDKVYFTMGDCAMEGALPCPDCIK